MKSMKIGKNIYKPGTQQAQGTLPACWNSVCSSFPLSAANSWSLRRVPEDNDAGMSTAAASLCFHCDFSLCSSLCTCGVLNDLPLSTSHLYAKVQQCFTSLEQFSIPIEDQIALQGGWTQHSLHPLLPLPSFLHKIRSRTRQQLSLPPHFKGWCLQLPPQTTLAQEGG